MLDTHARKYVQPIIRDTARTCLKMGLNPNQVTWAAWVIGMGAGMLVYFERSILAVFLLWVSGFLDAVDGSMAREANRMSAWGTLLDITFDRIVELGIIISLAIRHPHSQLLLLLLTASIVFSMTVFLTVGALSEKKGLKSFYYQAGLAERTEGLILLSLMTLFPKDLLWSTGLFLVMEVLTGLQRMREAKRLLT